MFVARPSIALADAVDRLWYYSAIHTHGGETVLPSTVAQLIIPLDEPDAAVLVGPSTRPKRIATAPMRRMVGAVFHPGGTRAFFRLPLHALVDCSAPLADLWRPTSDLEDIAGAATPESALVGLERLLRSHQHPDIDPTPWSTVASALARGATVDAVIERSGRSRTGFVRTFGAAVGLTPKKYARIDRFSRAVRVLAAGSASLSEVALECGYCDQSHFTHEFRRFADRTPSRYRPRSTDEPNHLID